MSSRTEQKAAARQARLEAEQAEAAKAARRRRLGILGGVAALAVVGVVLALALTGGSDNGKATVSKAQSSDVAALFAGIPQKGLVLGDPKAPVTVEEFIDPQCPFCKEFSKSALPTVLNNYVKTGKVKLQMRPLSFIGQDSVTAARMVAAAAQQNKGWTYLDVFYANQGEENSGYVTDDFLRQVGRSVPGLDVTKALKAAKTDAKLNDVLNEANARAQTLGANSTPTLVATKGSGAPQTIQLDPGDYVGSVTNALDALTGAGKAQ